MSQRVTITLSRQVEVKVLREAKARGMAVKDLCEELIEVALVTLGMCGVATPLDEQASRRHGDPMDDC